MAKKKKPTRGQAQNELKSLESKWLKDQRLHVIVSIPARVAAGKTAAVLDYAAESHIDVNVDDWPLAGMEDLVKLDQTAFKQGLENLRKAGVVNENFKLRRAATGGRAEIDLSSETGVLTYRCAKPGGVTLPDRDEYVQEDQEVTYSEENISESPSLQNAIANEWLVRIHGKRPPV
jgi:hypothetical protein